MLTRKQQFELITSISGRGEIPLKFAYLNDGAKYWDALSKKRANSEKEIHNMEQLLLQKRVTDFLSSFDSKKLNIIDLGCGNGTAVVPIIETAKKQGFEIKYVPLDISSEMLEIAENTIRKKFPGTEIIKKEIDFEAGNFSDFTYELSKNGYSNFFIFFGNTIGNFSDPGRVLSNFRDSMGPDDYLLIGTELENLSKTNLIIERYRGEKEVYDFVMNLPKKIGILEKEINYSVTWNEKKQQIEIKITLKKDVELKIGQEKLKLGNYEQILIARSKKYNENSITSLASESGFRNEMLTTNKERSYVLALIQPTRYGI
jgi:uncharacterized SAM-dependent methyltransferase